MAELRLREEVSGHLHAATTIWVQFPQGNILLYESLSPKSPSHLTSSSKRKIKCKICIFHARFNEKWKEGGEPPWLTCTVVRILIERLHTVATGCLGYNRGCSEEMSIQQLLIFFLLLGIFVLLFSLLFIFLFFLPRQNDQKPRHWAEVSSLVTDCSVFAFGTVKVLIEVHRNNGHVSAQLPLKKAPVEVDLHTLYWFTQVSHHYRWNWVCSEGTYFLLLLFHTCLV